MMMMPSEIPKGFLLTHNVIPADVWNTLDLWLHTDHFPSADGSSEGEFCPIPWQVGAQNRRVAQFGFRYDYENSIVDTATRTPQIPPTLENLLLDPARPTCSPDTQFTQCIINDYGNAETIIPWHKDHEDFGPVVLVYTFGDDRPLNFRFANKSDGTGDEDFMFYSAHPRHGSRYILSGPSRKDWEHCVPSGKGRRVSFTFRTHRRDN